MLTYFHSGSEPMVRAPHRRTPSPSNSRRTLTPSWFSTACASRSSTDSRPAAPSTASPVGGFKTPPASSPRA